MTNLRQAAEMALEALTTFERICSPEHLHIYETITIPEAVEALRQALAEPDAPPKFPTALRRMWSGTEVQEWINENWGKQ